MLNEKPKTHKKGHIHDSIYMKCSERANLWKQKVVARVWREKEMEYD